jgi:hypothetical protein
LDRRAELAPAVDEFEALDAEIKAPFKASDKGLDVFCGTRWHIISKKSKTTRIDTKALPETIRKEYEVTTESTKVIIADMGAK